MESPGDIEKKHDQIDREFIGNRLGQLIKSRNVKISKIEERSGVTKSCISRIIHGLRSINQQNLRRVLAPLNTTRDEFLKGIDVGVNILTMEKPTNPFSNKEQDDLDESISKWILASKEDFKTMQILLMNNRYVHCYDFLFSALEKILLALFLKIYMQIPPLPCKLSLLLDKIDPIFFKQQEKYLAILQKKFFDHQSITKRELIQLIQEGSELRNWIETQL